MQPLIQRRAELHICKALRAYFPDHAFVPYSGGDEVGDSFNIEPPFGVVAVTEAEKTHQQENTWLCKGSLQWITHMDESTPQDHDMAVRPMVHYLSIIPPSQEEYFTFHGIDISEEKRAEDESNSARASIVSFTVGVSG